METADAHASNDPVSGQSLLFVEDALGDARLVIEVLKMARPMQFAVTHVLSLGHALRALQLRCYDAVLLDLGLPDSRGLEAVEKVRASAPDIPLVVLTGNDDEELAVRAIEKGAQDFLVKRLPFPSPARLVRTLRYAMARRGPLPKPETGDLSATVRRRAIPSPGAECLRQLERMEPELDLAKVRLRRAATMDPLSHTEDQRKQALAAELKSFSGLLEGHFAIEDEYCGWILSNPAWSIVEKVWDVLEEHRSIKKELTRLLERLPNLSLDDARRSVLSGLCEFIEHEIAEMVVFKGPPPA